MENGKAKQLLDRIQDIVGDGQNVPFAAGKVLVNKEEVLEIVEELKTTIDLELKAYHEITDKRSKIIKEAEQEADEIIAEAEETASRAEVGRIAVMGGTEPGHTTEAVAMMVASCMDADRVVNATSVDAVYTDDPRSNQDAVRIPEMTIERLGEIVYKEHGASKSSVFDPLGVKIAAEKNIDIMIVDGRNLDELRKAILGERFDGTFVDSH